MRFISFCNYGLAPSNWFIAQIKDLDYGHNNDYHLKMRDECYCKEFEIIELRQAHL